MRKILLGLALATTALTTPAVAQEGYLELDAGVVKPDDMDFDLNTDVDNNDDDQLFSVDNKLGFDVAAIAGFDFGAFRLEGELAYKQADADHFNVDDDDVSDDNEDFFDLDGDTSVISLMGNALADFGSDDGLQGFVGGGVGIAKVDVDLNDDDFRIVDDEARGFAWQLLAGIRYPVSENWDLGLKYRFFNVEGLN